MNPMMWYERMAKRWQVEQEIAHRFMQNVEAGFDERKLAYIRGLFPLVSEHGHQYDAFRIKIKYPSRFPENGCCPAVYLESHRDQWRNGRDAHIEADWKLCLFVPKESGIKFERSDSMEHLFACIHTFLFKEYIYQRDLIREGSTGKPAVWLGPARAHGFEGIREVIGNSKIGRNELCPCGSGRKFKHCCLHENREVLVEKKVKDGPNGPVLNGAGPNLEMYAATLGSIQEQVRFADSKAGFIAALNAILFGFLASNFEGVRLVYAKIGGGNTAFRIAVTALILYLIATAISIVQVILAVASRFGELAPQSKVFFGHIIKNYGKDYSKYVRETLALSDRGWAEEIGTQIVEVSHIALTKHRLVRRAAWFTLFAFGGWLISLIAIAFLPVVKP